jgi:hypothetical protein
VISETKAHMNTLFFKEQKKYRATEQKNPETTAYNKEKTIEKAILILLLNGLICSFKLLIIMG